MGLFSSYFKMRSYRNVLQQIGDNGGGFEKINGKWYRITEVSESDKEIIEDMGIPMCMKRI